MGKSGKVWHPKFAEYMEYIASHPNYNGLPINRDSNHELKWIATAKSDIGEGRCKWALTRAVEFGIPNQPGVYADVMLRVHPTKRKVCQICGNEMSLYYVYPNEHFIKALHKEFGIEFTNCDSIIDIWNVLREKNVSKKDIKEFLIIKFNLKDLSVDDKKDDLLVACEYACRKGNKKYLGPGAMSNFPDRYDGFHTYNRCCRKTEDTGRHDDNMKTYGKDRRAFEYWSDGNIQAANKFMNSEFFKGQSADHIGPISLGFVHDPCYLVPMRSGDNSAKRDRLSREDIDKILQVEFKTEVKPMSWYSELIWEHIKNNYNNVSDEYISNTYRNAFKQNMVNFMYVLNCIIENTNGRGAEFLIAAFITPKMVYFKYDYYYDVEVGILRRVIRTDSDNTRKEFCRFARIAIDAVAEYNDKSNRHFSHDLTYAERETLNSIIQDVKQENSVDALKEKLEKLMRQIQNRIISSI